MPERIFKMNILLSRSTDEGANRRTAPNGQPFHANARTQCG